MPKYRVQVDDYAPKDIQTNSKKQALFRYLQSIVENQKSKGERDSIYYLNEEFSWSYPERRSLLLSLLYKSLDNLVRTYVLVPDVLARNYHEAENLIEANALRFVKLPSQEGDIVVKQTPDAGTLVLENSEVQVLFGDSLVVVPNVIGYDEEQAKEILLNFQLKPITKVKAGLLFGTEVVGQKPSFGEKIEKGSKVEIWLGVKESFYLKSLLKDLGITQSKPIKSLNSIQ